jgi:hypothetical protein
LQKAVKDLCTAYGYLEEGEKLKFFQTIAEKYSVDQGSVVALSKSLIDCTVGQMSNLPFPLSHALHGISNSRF